MELSFSYIGWCCETDSKGSEHDKIWLAMQVGSKYYAAWGARGKTVNFKEHPYSSSLYDVERSKRKKYDTISVQKLLEIWPNFYEDVESRLVFCTLANKIR